MQQFVLEEDNQQDEPGIVATQNKQSVADANDDDYEAHEDQLMKGLGQVVHTDGA